MRHLEGLRNWGGAAGGIYASFCLPAGLSLSFLATLEAPLPSVEIEVGEKLSFPRPSF